MVFLHIRLLCNTLAVTSRTMLSSTHDNGPECFVADCNRTSGSHINYDAWNQFEAYSIYHCKISLLGIKFNDISFNQENILYLKINFIATQKEWVGSSFMYSDEFCTLIRKYVLIFLQYWSTLVILKWGVCVCVCVCIYVFLQLWLLRLCLPLHLSEQAAITNYFICVT
jgi:hypothetical protein